MILDIHNTRFEFSALKCVYWEQHQTLICADIHIGKGAHFRNNGIGVPVLLNKNNFWNLAKAFDQYNPKNFLVLGDMVHSTENLEWAEFSDFLDNYPTMNRMLVRGNHELYGNEHYTSLGFEVHERLKMDSLLFTHEPESVIPEGIMNLCGHIHPAIRLLGTASQSVRLPCYWIRKGSIVLPAFGEFTGMHAIKPKRGDRVIAVADKKVIEILPDQTNKQAKT